MREREREEKARGRLPTQTHWTSAHLCVCVCVCVAMCVCVCGYVRAFACVTAPLSTRPENKQVFGLQKIRDDEDNEMHYLGCATAFYHMGVSGSAHPYSR